MKKSNQSRPKKFIGQVVSDKMTETVVVEVSRRLPHPKYRKVMTSKSKMYADNKVKARLGDRVEIQEIRPKSKLKRFKVLQVIKG